MVWYRPRVCGHVVGEHCVFFFSSRRRHTRLQGDWSSDVCSSDLESPVYVSRQGDAVRAVGGAPTEPRCVTGGVYGFSAGARGAAAEALGRGVQRMRGFLKALVDEGRRVAAVEVARIIDIDRPSDLQTANAWLAARER